MLLLTGNAGVGKSTVAKAWAAQRGGACVTGDDVYLWIRVREVRRAEFHQERVVADVAIEAARQFLRLGLDVVIDYVWRPQGIRRLMDGLAADARVRAVHLTCDRAANLVRNDNRSRGVLPAETVDRLGDELAAMAWQDDVTVVESTSLSPDQTVSSVERIFGR